jgi:hypothetical protein
MLLGLDSNGGTGMSEEWAMRLAIEELKNLGQLLLAERLLNGGTWRDTRMSEEGRQKDDVPDRGERRQGEWLEESREAEAEDRKGSSRAEAPANHNPRRES